MRSIEAPWNYFDEPLSNDAIHIKMKTYYFPYYKSKEKVLYRIYPDNITSGFSPRLRQCCFHDKIPVFSHINNCGIVRPQEWLIRQVIIFL
jgi:hypothetical protein